MNVTRQEVSQQLTHELPKRRSTSASVVLSGMLLLATSGALGYYAFELHRERETLRKELAASQSEALKLRSEGQARAQALTQLQLQNNEHSAQLVQTKAQLENVQTELAAAQTRLDELNQERGAIEEELAEFKQMTEQLRRMIDSGRLQVTFRKGRMIVELPAQVLFPSGSAELTEEGRGALADVAKSLRGLKSRRFIVAGHTDNVPVSGGRFASNWELSSARAVTVTDALVRGGLKPEQLVAAGYSEYDPVARNTAEKGRQKNRRIEIILEPRLRPIPGLNSAKK